MLWQVVQGRFRMLLGRRNSKIPPVPSRFGDKSSDDRSDQPQTRVIGMLRFCLPGTLAVRTPFPAPWFLFLDSPEP